MRKLWWVLVLLLAACGTDQGPAAEPLRLLSGTLPPAYLGERYEATLEVAGGLRPYEVTLERGKLPKGLRFFGGRITGVPQEKGSFKLTVVVKDAGLSAVTRTVTLSVGDPPPPKFALALPKSEVKDPFILVARVADRETRGFAARFLLKDLEPDLKTLKLPKDARYVVRYLPEKAALDLDVVFAKAMKGKEAFRVYLKPKKPRRPAVSYRAFFLDKNASPLPGQRELKREGEGRFTYKDLVALARAWGQKAKKDQKLAMDLDGDGAVGEKDLALLRAGYSWRLGFAAKKAKPSPAKTPKSPGKAPEDLP